jgi:tight adherence protein B
MRRIAAIAVVMGVLAALPASASAAAGGPHLSPLDVPFPQRAFVLTLPAPLQLSAAQLRVTENGQPVNGLTLVPASASRTATFGVVLLIDSSLSMHGQPIADALAAARAFDAHRNLDERIAVIEFNRTPTVILPLTADEARIRSALAATPHLAYGTRIDDAVTAGLRLLAQGRVTAGTILVLSDGADTGSTLTPKAAAAQAAAQHVRIFSVGLHSASFTPRTLRALAAGSGGEFTEAASSTELSSIYAALSARLASQYVVRYRSLLGPDQAASVRVSISGLPAAATASYTTPALPRDVAPVYRPPLLQSFFESAGGMLLTVLVCAGLFGAAVSLALRPRGRTLRRRMSQFVSLHTEVAAAESNRLTARVFGGVERPLRRVGRWTRFKEDVAIAGFTMPAIQILLWTFVTTALFGLLLWVVSRSPVLPVLAFVVPAVVYESINTRLRRVRGRFAEQLPDNLQVLASALRAGHSLVGALSVVVDDCPEPSRSELRRVIADEQLGVPLEDAIDRVVQRMDNRDLGQVGLVASLQRQTGGNTAEVVDRVTETVRERFELRRLVRTLTAQGRMSRWIVSGLPIVLLVAISIINPAYLTPLLHHTLGQIMLAIGGIMIVVGSFVIRRIVNIEV